MSANKQRGGGRDWPEMRTLDMAFVRGEQAISVKLWRLAEQAAQERGHKCQNCQGAGQSLGQVCDCAEQQAVRNAAREERRSNAHH